MTKEMPLKTSSTKYWLLQHLELVALVAFTVLNYNTLLFCAQPMRRKFYTTKVHVKINRALPNM